MPKFNDENIKAAFENRSIRPSEEAWQKLETQLGTDKSKSGLRKVWQLAAAVLMLLLPLGWLLFQPQVSEPIVANVPEAPQKIEKVISAKVAPIPENDVQETPTSKIVEISKDQKPLKEQNTVKKKPSVVKKKVEMNPEPVSVSSRQKMEVVNDAEVDALLAEAQQELQAEKSTLVDRIANIPDEEIQKLLQKAKRELEAEEETEWLMAEILSQEKEVEIQSRSRALLAEVEADLDKNIYDKIYHAVALRLEKFKDSITKS